MPHVGSQSGQLAWKTGLPARGSVIVLTTPKNLLTMVQIIALAVAVVICFILFGKEITKINVNPLIIILLGISLIMIAHEDGNTIQFGPMLMSSHWLPQMLGIVLVFLLIVIPGPRLTALIRAEKSTGYKTLATTLIGILVCVLVGMIAVMAASHKFAIPLLLNR
jgi:drug/metabolite transporter (DMT)-like permease